MAYPPPPMPVPARPVNSMAATSMWSGIAGWAFVFINLCLNLVLVPMLTVATLGFGGILYLCTGALWCLSPLGWLIGVITGHMAKSQIRQTGEGGDGQATAGLIMGYIGLGLTILGVCVGLILLIVGAISIPLMNQIQ